MNCQLSNLANPTWSNFTLESLRHAVDEVNVRISERGFILGEMGKVQDYNVVSLGNATHKITEVQLKEDGIYGTVEFLDTERGKMAKYAIESGAGFKVRGNHLPDDHHVEILTWDITLV